MALLTTIQMIPKQEALLAPDACETRGTTNRWKRAFFTCTICGRHSNGFDKRAAISWNILLQRLDHVSNQKRNYDYQAGLSMCTNRFTNKAHLPNCESANSNCN